MYKSALRSAVALAERRYLRILAVLFPALLLVLGGTVAVGLAAWVVGATLSQAQYGHAAFILMVASQVVVLPAMCRIAGGEGMWAAARSSVSDVPAATVLSVPYVAALAGAYALDGPVVGVACMILAALLIAPTVFVYAARAERVAGVRDSLRRLVEHPGAVLLMVLPASMVLQGLLVPVVSMILGPIAAYVLVQPLLVCSAVAAARAVSPDAVGSLESDRAAAARRGLELPEDGDWVEVRGGGSLWVTVTWAGTAPQLVVADSAQGWVTVPQPSRSGAAHELALPPGWYFVGARLSEGAAAGSRVGIVIHRRSSDRAA